MTGAASPPRRRATARSLAAGTLLLAASLSSACSQSNDPVSADRDDFGNSESEAPSSQQDACALVREGIRAFNGEEFQDTVEMFELAVTAAERELADLPDDAPAFRVTRAEKLVEAVEYYAELAPDDYPTAAAESPEFARYKRITLGQCAQEGEPLVPTEPPAVEA